MNFIVDKNYNKTPTFNESNIQTYQYPFGEMAREVLDMKPITLPESPSAHQQHPHPPQLVIDLTEWTEGESDSFALNETKIANTTIDEPTTNDPYTMHVNEMNQQLLDFLMNQLRPYGIVDPDSVISTTTIPPSTSTSLPSNAAEVMKNLVSNNGTAMDEIVNAQQMQFFRDYVMQQLMPLGIVGSSEKPVTSSSTTVTPSTTTTTASVTKSNLMNFNLPQNLDVKTLLSILHALEKNKDDNSNHVISA